MPNPAFKYNYETRINTVLEVLKGKKVQTVARETRIHRATINNWIAAYREEAERRLKTPIIDTEMVGKQIKPECDRPNRLQRLLNYNLSRRETVQRLSDCWRVDPFQAEERQD
ncbi:helix-turn-helix domain-containing protein [Synechococcus elongatus]|uniref:helix-turn-helix domain-containing protein n=1 Tax=Synechococcus elongatus TaxID=32046 RepID=UPI000F7DEE1D|nr:helix-turn-helix domain-containing protein [Synechococcus elongatus]